MSDKVPTICCYCCQDNFSITDTMSFKKKFELSRVLSEMLCIDEDDSRKLIDRPVELKGKPLTMTNLLSCAIHKWKVGMGKKVALFSSVLGWEPQGSGYKEVNLVTSTSAKTIGRLTGAAREDFLYKLATGVEDLLSSSTAVEETPSSTVMETPNRPKLRAAPKRKTRVERLGNIELKTRLLTKYRVRVVDLSQDTANRKVLTTKLWRTKKKLKSLRLEQVEQSEKITKLEVVKMARYTLKWHFFDLRMSIFGG